MREREFHPVISVPTTTRICTTREVHSSISVSVSDNGRNLSFSCSSEEKERRFHPVWLRHNCHCSQCLQFRAQKTIPAEDLSRDLKISAANVEGK